MNLDGSTWQKMGASMAFAAMEGFAGLAGMLGQAGAPGAGGAPGVGGFGAGALWGIDPQLAAGMYAFQLAAPLLQRFLEGLPEWSRTGDLPARDSQVHKSRHKRAGQEGADVQGEIDRILNSSLSLEEKIILIAGLVSESVGGQLEELLQQQGQMARRMDASAAGTAQNGGAQMQNVENRIQLLMQRLSRMQTLSSNLLQSLHATQRAVLSNIRV